MIVLRIEVSYGEHQFIVIMIRGSSRILDNERTSGCNSLESNVRVVEVCTSFRGIGVQFVVVEVPWWYRPL